MSTDVANRTTPAELLDALRNEQAEGVLVSAKFEVTRKRLGQSWAWREEFTLASDGSVRHESVPLGVGAVGIRLVFDAGEYHTDHGGEEWPWFAADRGHIVRAFAAAGFGIDAPTADALWARVSDELGAGWVPLPEEDHAIVDSCRPFFTAQTGESA